ncbi:MAG: arylesterase [Desulfobulbus sp.]|uniref:GDSL-type esterase/lipase family protein n=1 Tax=uncultured Desulfobulbus sp. TaxID=239745 RepID=UPI001B5F89D3|nr:GDSL-type esterase/lipase family protein [uncultured Desulfobulbus sp.]MBP7517853.1 arylesterase [Desulfobulbus sp.]
MNQPAASALAGRLLAAWILCLVLAGCTPPPELEPLAADAVVLAFGDSLTFGTGAGPGESYPEVLSGLIGRTVVNAGVPGEVSTDGLLRLPALLDREQPALLLLCHGGNDQLQRLDPARLADNLRAMIREARDRNIAVVLIAVPAPGLSLRPLPLYAGIADEFGLAADLETVADILGDRALKSDYIHPNAAGYRRLALAVADLLRAAGAVP